MDTPAKAGRILALDVGERRIGLAVSDALGITAQGLPTLERHDLAQDLDALRRLAREYHIVSWLLGLPLHLSGQEGRQAGKVRRLGAALERHTRVPVVYWDERFTTVEATRVLREAGSTRDQHRRAVDRLAAVILLQSFLDASSPALDSSAAEER